MDLIVCPTCQGSGYQDRRLCHECRGAVRGLMFGDKFLYWGRPISRFDIKLRHLKELLDDIINALALAATLGFLALFFYAFYRVNGFGEVLNLKFQISTLPQIKFFWWSALGFLFLIYRLGTLRASRRPVLRREYGKEALTFREAAWDEVKRTRRRNVIDVSKSFSDELLRAVDDAYAIARKWRHAEMNLVHFFAALLRTQKVQYVIIRIDQEKYQQLLEMARRALTSEPKTTNQLVVDPKIFKILISAYAEAYKDKEDLVESLPALYLTREADKTVETILYDLGIDKSKLRNAIEWIRNTEKLRKKLSRFRRAAHLKPKGAMNRAMTALSTPALDRWSQDFTRLAAYGYFPPVVGREEQFEALWRVAQSGRGAILIGFPGVGKDTIMQGIASRMVEEDVPKILYDKRLVALNIAELISGASAIEASERIMQVFNDIRRSRNVVLYIPHIERLIGIGLGGSGGEALDLATLVANEIARGYFICFASADINTYRNLIEKSALRDMFEKVEVPEPKADSAIQIIETATAGIEVRHKVFFSYDAISRAVNLSDRYLHERYLPEKALEILREAAVLAHQTKGVNQFVSGEDVAKIVSEKAKVPVTAITEDESKKLINLEEQMHTRIIGQNEAVGAIARAIRRARAELREAKRPIANFLFLGPTGVGKTEAAKALSVVYFGNEKNMTRLDMSEYQDKASVAKIIGVSGERGGGLLTEAIREKPFTLLLLDEIEKAHPDILNLFLQVMDDGRLTDNEGRTIDFTNVILIATSNAGTPFIQAEVQKSTPIEQIKDRLVREELKGVFRPEFLNRFDGVIIFKPLSKDEIEQITWLMLSRITRQLEEKGIDFEATDAAVKELAAAGFDPIFGARPLRRVIQERVEDGIARLLLEARLTRRDKIIYDVGGEIGVEKAKRL